MTQLADRLARGKSTRAVLPRSAHGDWSPPKDRPDPVTTLERSSTGRVPELLPLRYGRMAVSPFTFLRGAAAAMAEDLATTPNSGLRVQLCGDCHLLNFGAFGTPERLLLFDLMDFDETLPGPFEWDVKRLVASVLVAARSIGLRDAVGKGAVLAAARTYREGILEHAERSPLDLWHARLTAEEVIATAPTKAERQAYAAGAAKARAHTVEQVFPKLTTVVNGRRRFVDRPPSLFHPPMHAGWEEELHRLISRYRESIPDDRRALFDRFELVDLATKVVGVGSVGTRCGVALFLAGDAPLLLQIKEARRSVLEPFAGKSVYAHQGRRVVEGQRLVQPAADIFLGWTEDDEGRHYYFRQLQDMKGSVDVTVMSAAQLAWYAGLCGRVLARAHAKGGDAAVLAGYLGKGDTFDQALARFAIAYADQTEQDHAALVAAIAAGRIIATPHEPPRV
ncbi:MAG: DUF2252 domain-containing protein [Gemmataceae bacterium]